jgi:hypothetical protein
MPDPYKPGQIMSQPKDPPKYCCLHKNIVPLEYMVARVSHPNGYKAEPFYEFAISLINANRIRVKSFYCLDCKMEIKAPNPGELKTDRL